MRIKFFSVVVANILLMTIGCTAPVNNISQQVLMSKMASDNPPLLIDVRSKQEFSDGHLLNAINIPHTELAARLSEIGQNKDRNIVLYCLSGTRAKVAQKILFKNKFSQVEHLSGDFSAWQNAGLSIEVNKILNTLPAE